MDRSARLQSARVWLKTTLKWFARLLGGDKRVIRKAELISLIAEHLQGDHLRDL
jgi:hypothetical protein